MTELYTVHCPKNKLHLRKKKTKSRLERMQRYMAGLYKYLLYKLYIYLTQKPDISRHISSNRDRLDFPTEKQKDIWLNIRYSTYLPKSVLSFLSAEK